MNLGAWCCVVFGKLCDKVSQNGRAGRLLQDEVTGLRIYPSTQSKQIHHIGNSGFQNTGEEAAKECDLWEKGKEGKEGAALGLLSSLPQRVSGPLHREGTWGPVQQAPWGAGIVSPRKLRADVDRKVAGTRELHRGSLEIPKRCSAEGRNCAWVGGKNHLWGTTVCGDHKLRNSPCLSPVAWLDKVSSSTGYWVQYSGSSCLSSGEQFTALDPHNKSQMQDLKGSNWFQVT